MFFQIIQPRKHAYITMITHLQQTDRSYQPLKAYIQIIEILDPMIVQYLEFLPKKRGTDRKTHTIIYQLINHYKLKLKLNTSRHRTNNFMSTTEVQLGVNNIPPPTATKAPRSRIHIIIMHTNIRSCLGIHKISAGDLGNV